MSTVSVGKLARRFGLSRTTLLYYDRIGLLTPSGRSAAGYRFYGEDRVRRLEAICRYREAGVPLAQITALVGGAPRSVAIGILERRLDQLNREIAARREQQRILAQLMADPRVVRRRRTSRPLDKAAWVAILRASGLDDAAMARWHAEFERAAPDAHEDFLRSLGIAAAEVARIRKWSRT
jgi:MerR family transcriptional regulator, thiopeptide resistance regulator